MRTTLIIDSSKWPEVWQAAYRVLEQYIVPNQLQAWIQPLVLSKTEEINGGLRIHISAPNDFSMNWVKDQYKDLIEKAFSQVIGCHSELVLSIDERSVGVLNQPFDPPVETRTNNSTRSALSVATNSSKISGTGAMYNETNLDSRYIFNTFVVGASNEFAHASALAVAAQPATQYNPLFIYSPPGLGKTHLLHAIGDRFIKNDPTRRVVYLSAERFVNELIDSLQHNRMPAFRNKYRDSYDMILIDDIQFIAGKTKSEEEFFHTFNALHSSKRQIVVTSDRPPKEINGLEERVRTRFEWGLIADIKPPEIETRIAILKGKAERDDIYLPDDVATFIATYIRSNVRELEGQLVRLQAQASLSGGEISLEMAKNELRNAIPEEGSNFTIESIQGAVSKRFDIRIQELKSSTRTQEVALPRQIAMYLIRKYTGLTYKEISHFFGGKDHTTILHACNKIEKGVENNQQIREAVESVLNLL